MILSLVVGFLCPASFLFTLFLIFYFTGQRPSYFVMLVAWPGVLLQLMVDLPRSDANLAAGIAFIAICDTIVYGAITYVILTVVSIIRPKTVTQQPPPTPKEFRSGPLNSD